MPRSALLEGTAASARVLRRTPFPLWFSNVFQAVCSIGAARVHGADRRTRTCAASRRPLPSGVGHPGMAPRRARPGRRAVPGFARGTLIFLWVSKDFSLTSGKTKITTISIVFARFLLSWLL